MLSFNSSVSIIICSRTESGRKRWAEVFQRLFANFTQSEQLGGWVGREVVETEANTRVTCWLPSGGGDFDLSAFLDLAHSYQVAEEQEAVSIELVADGQWRAFIIERTDWEAAHQHMAQLIAQMQPVG